ncbi:MAG: SMC-Scp complex subunit ScpB [Bdellovibrionales bacterium GWB1_55_8]|nr:MAG: SMC-Scp complex subunit ScpB [Bdellovibrionales bacterium GWB1_55_8]
MTDKEQDNGQGIDFVSLVQDPYGFRNTEIADAQNSTEPLDIDSDLDADLDPELIITERDDTELDRVASAVAEATQEFATQAAANAAEATDDRDAEAELAAQIAEDEALAQRIAEENALAESEDPELRAALPVEPVADSEGNLDLREVESCIEALLFMTDKPMSVKKLQDLLGPDFSDEIFTSAVASLMTRYQTVHHGVELVEVAGGLQLRTKPGRAALAKKLAKVQTQRLSSGGMESLAIVAYRQPVMKEDIDKIRGVDSSYFIRGLLDKKLIQITGRSELPGRPMLYGTTNEFLEIFGLKDLSGLPSLHEIEKMIPASQSDNPNDEDPRVKEMRRLVNQMKTDTSTSLVYNPREDEKILKEIRERVNSIPTSTPYLDEQKAAEKQAQIDAKNAQNPPEMPAVLLATPEVPAELPASGS